MTEPRPMFVLLALVIVALPRIASAEDDLPNEAPSAHFHYSETLLGRMNPLGLENELLLSYRVPVSHRTDSALLKETYWGPVIGVKVSPAAFRPVIGFEAQPLRIVTLFVRYEPAAYYGALRSVLSYPSASADAPVGYFVSGPEPHGANYATIIHQFTGGLSLQAEYKNAFARSASRIHYESANLHPGDTVYYDSTFDMLVARKGWVFENDTDLGWSFGPHVKAGLRYATILTWYPADAYAPGEPRTGSNSPIMRAGPIAQYELGAHEFGPFATAAIFGTANWFIDHRYRTGEEVSRAAPFVGGGFTLTGDL